MAFQPIFDSFATRPKTQTMISPMIGLHNVIRDQFPIWTWLLFGALLQGIASVLLPYRNIVLILPVLLTLLYKALYTLLLLTGLITDPRLAGVIPYRTTVILPTEKGMPSTPAASPVCAIVLAVVSHHPLGMLAPGYNIVAARFDRMVAQLSQDASTHGFLGASSWINSADHTTSNENMTILYFENEDYLHAYAHGPMHSEAMLWWREYEKTNRHVGIMHEVFACPKRSWEAVYTNYKPVGLGSVTKEVTDANGQKSWVNPLVKIKGKLLYSNGRMGKTVGEHEWDALTGLSPEELEA